jgi:hypothetical protein
MSEAINDEPSSERRHRRYLRQTLKLISLLDGSRSVTQAADEAGIGYIAASRKIKLLKSLVDADSSVVTMSRRKVGREVFYKVNLVRVPPHHTVPYEDVPTAYAKVERMFSDLRRGRSAVTEQPSWNTSKIPQQLIDVHRKYVPKSVILTKGGFARIWEKHVEDSQFFRAGWIGLDAAFTDWRSKEYEVFWNLVTINYDLSPDRLEHIYSKIGELKSLIGDDVAYLYPFIQAPLEQAEALIGDCYVSADFDREYYRDEVMEELGSIDYAQGKPMKSLPVFRRLAAYIRLGLEEAIPKPSRKELKGLSMNHLAADLANAVVPHLDISPVETGRARADYRRKGRKRRAKTKP